VPKLARRLSKPQRKRAPNLTPERIEGITEIIRDWRGSLRLDALCDVIERKTGARYTRQALHNHTQIRAAYQAYREKPVPAESDKVSSRQERQIRNLKLRVKELDTICSGLLERFARWAVNAAEKGLDEEFLDRPLVEIDRAQAEQ
jgi:hypothetical protein